MRTSTRSVRSEERKRKREWVALRGFTRREDEELLRKCAYVQKANELKRMDSSVFEQKYTPLFLFTVVLVI